MPSPVAHALAGAVFGLCVQRNEIPKKTWWPLLGRFDRSFFSIIRGKEILIFGTLGLVPDIDFLFGTHSTVTHSVGAVVLLFIFAALISGRAMFSFACAIAYWSHLLLDWAGTDVTAPYGIMMFWPYSQEFFLSEVSVFSGICREFSEYNCWQHNLRALGWELLVLGPLAIFMVIRSRSTRNN
tara:strand:- start:7595 stop:8143 length:549 start_codon:yes stop_codon:yes gene_type:complete